MVSVFGSTAFYILSLYVYTTFKHRDTYDSFKSIFFSQTFYLSLTLAIVVLLFLDYSIVLFRFYKKILTLA